MQKFLIIQTAFIGDVVLATIIIEKLHANFPDAQIDFLLRKGNEGLLQNHPYLNEVLIWVKKKDKTKNLFKLINIIRRKKYDKVINVQRFFSTGLITALSNAKEKIGFDKNPLSFLFDVKVKHIIGTKENPVHEVQRNLSLISHFTDGEPAKMKLYPSKEDFDKAGSIVNSQLSIANYVCVAPSSVWFTKQFPPEKWIEFIQSCDSKLKIYLLGAPSDHHVCESIRLASAHSGVVNLSGKLSFLESAALIGGAQMNFVNDSAPMHMASSMNAPVTAIFCSTLPSFGFGPLSDKSFVVETKEKLDCCPCGSHGLKECPKGHFKCAYSIPNKDLVTLLSV